MALPIVFISYDVKDDEEAKTQFVNESDKSPTPFVVKGESNDWILTPMAALDLEIEIKFCNILIVLVGKYTALSDNVPKEIGIANYYKVPVFGVYIGGADHNSDLPDGLQRNRTMSLAVNGWRDIGPMIDQCMREKKNFHNLLR